MIGWLPNRGPGDAEQEANWERKGQQRKTMDKKELVSPVDSGYREAGGK